MGFLKGFLDPVVAFFGKLTLNQKLSIVMVSASLVVPFIVLIMLSGGEKYETVAGAMEGQTLAQAKQVLREARIPFRISDGQVMVKRAYADEAFAVIAYRAGDEAVSFSFDDLVKEDGFSWQTAEERRTRLLVATQNRLATYIKKFPGVKSALVTLDLPRERLRLSARDLGSATVGFETRGSVELSEREYHNIAKMVAGVSRMLTAERITVTNLSTGRTVIPRKTDDEMGDPSDRLKAQKAVASQLEEKILGLYGMLGSQNVVVRVFPKLDMTKRKTQETIPDARTAIVENAKETEETRSAGAGAPPGVTPNTSANIPAGAGGAGTGSYTKKEKVEPIMLAPAVKKIDTIEWPGDLKEVRVSVIVNSDRIREIAAAKPGVAGTDGKADEKKLAAEAQLIIADLKALIALPGLKAEDVQFKSIPFARPTLAGVAEAPWLREFLTENLGVLGLLSVALLAVLLVFAHARRAMPRPAMPELPSIRKLEEEVEEALEEAPDPEAQRVAKMTDRIGEIVEKSPPSSASLVRRWVRGE